MWFWFSVLQLTRVQHIKELWGVSVRGRLIVSSCPHCSGLVCPVSQGPSAVLPWDQFSSLFLQRVVGWLWPWLLRCLLSVLQLNLSRYFFSTAQVCVRAENQFPAWPEAGGLPCRLGEDLPYIAFFKLELNWIMWFSELLSKFKSSSRVYSVSVASWERNQHFGK